ncbi:hypothetical protein O9X98_06015 [Agrobacterium salinitolerans]|nr:hypothetical protein [Agrobacterium salinitolerans]
MIASLSHSLKFHLQNTHHAKKVAKAIKQHLHQEGVQIKLSKAQAIVAKIYGYADWYAMERSVADSNPVGPLDKDLAQDALAVRYRHSLDVLFSEGIALDAAEALLSKVSPTGGDGGKPELLEWRRTADQKMECRGGHGFDLRILQGMLDEAAESAKHIDLAPPSHYQPALTKHGFSAFPILEDGTAIGWPRFSAMTEEGVRNLVTQAWEAKAKAARELKSMRRETVAIPFEDIESNVEIIETITVTAGIRILRCVSGSELEVSAEWVRKLPPILQRPGLLDGDTCSYDLHRDGALIIVSFPQFFTPSERTRAAKELEDQFPATARYLALGSKASSSDALKAARGFSRDSFAYTIEGVLPLDDGTRTAFASVVLVNAHISETEDEELLNQIHLFRIAPGVDLGFFKMFNPDEHEYLGIAGITQDEWRDQMNRDNVIREDYSKRRP